MKRRKGFKLTIKVDDFDIQKVHFFTFSLSLLTFCARSCNRFGGIRLCVDSRSLMVWNIYNVENSNRFKLLILFLFFKMFRFKSKGCPPLEVRE